MHSTLLGFLKACRTFAKQPTLELKVEKDITVDDLPYEIRQLVGSIIAGVDNEAGEAIDLMIDYYENKGEAKKAEPYKKLIY